MINKWSMKEIILWSTPLKNGGAHPLFYGGMRTHYFMGACALIFKRARRALIFKRARRALIFKRAQALIIQRQTSKEQLQSGHERKSSWNALLKKWGRAPIIFEGSSTHLFEGSSTHFLGGHEHSLFEEQSNGEWVNNCKMNMKEISSWNALLKKWGRAPIIFEGSSTHYFGGSSTHLLGGHEHSPFEEHSIREQMNEHTWI